MSSFPVPFDLLLQAKRFVGNSPWIQHPGVFQLMADFANKVSQERAAEIVYLKERLHKCDGMAKEINLLTEENKRLREAVALNKGQYRLLNWQRKNEQS